MDVSWGPRQGRKKNVLLELCFPVGREYWLEGGVGRGRCEKTKQQPYFLEDAKSTEPVCTWTRSE